MATKRKRRAFGSAPAAHVVHARDAAKSARWWAKEFRKQLRGSNCVSALDAMLTANRMSTMTTVNRRHSGKVSPYQAGLFKSIAHRFYLKCVR